jgi:hypothetical protein
VVEAITIPHNPVLAAASSRGRGFIKGGRGVHLLKRIAGSLHGLAEALEASSVEETGSTPGALLGTLHKVTQGSRVGLGRMKDNNHHDQEGL